MKVKNKATRFIISFVLMCAMIITSAVPAFAAGAEDWSSSTKTYVGSMHMTDNNLTQVKTIKRTGTLHIVGHFYGEDAHAAVSPIRLTAQIRYAYGGAIGNASITKDDNRSGLQVQIFFDASSISNPPGYYRRAFIEYWYYIS